MPKKRERRPRPSPSSEVPQVPQKGGREGSVPVAGRDPYPSDRAVVLAQPKGQSRGQKRRTKGGIAEARTGRALQGLFRFKCPGPLEVLNTAK